MSKSKGGSARLMSVSALVIVVPALLFVFVPFLGAFSILISVPAMFLAGVALVNAFKRSERVTIVISIFALLIGAATTGLALFHFSVLQAVFQSSKTAVEKTTAQIEDGLEDAEIQFFRGVRDSLFALRSGIKELVNEIGPEPEEARRVEDALAKLDASLTEMKSVELGLGPIPFTPVTAEDLAKLKPVKSPLTPGRYLGDPGRDFLSANAAGNSPAAELPSVTPIAMDVGQNGQMFLCDASKPLGECDQAQVTWFEDSRGRLRPVIKTGEEDSLLGHFELSESSDSGFTILLTEEFMQEWLAAQDIKDNQEFASIPLRFTLGPTPISPSPNCQPEDSRNK